MLTDQQNDRKHEKHAGARRAPARERCARERAPLGLLRRLMLALLLGVIVPEAFADDRKKLIILNGYNESAPWAQEVIMPIMREISHREDFKTVETVHMNCTQIHTRDEYENMATGIFNRFADRKPDYVVLVGNFAFMLRDRIVEHWGNVPMLLVATSDLYGPLEYYFTYPDGISEDFSKQLKPLSELHGDYNFTLVHSPAYYEQTVDLMVEMLPAMNRLVFVADALYFNRTLNRQIKDYIERRYPDIDYEWLIGNQDNGERLQRYLNDNNPAVGLLLSTWFFERTTVHGYPQPMAGESRMISGARHPVFGLRSAYFPYGIIGGYFPSPGEVQGHIHKGLMDMISGKNLSKVPFMRAKESFPMVNFEVLERDSIPEALCPEDTVYINRPASPWELYRSYFIAGVIVLVIAIGAASAIIIFQRRRIAMLRSHNRMISSMPIGFTKAEVVYSDNGRVSDIVYFDGNRKFDRILEDNHLKGLSNVLFEEEFIAGEVQQLADRMAPTRFMHYFAATDTYFDFLLCIDSTEGRKLKVINIFAIDITDAKKQEKALIVAREKATESDKLKMAFLANMSHEIRTPLNAIVGFSELLGKTDDPEKKAKFVNIIETNNTLLLQLIGDVLDVAKMESNTLDFSFRYFDLNEMMRVVKSTVSMRMKPGVTLNMVFGAPKCIVNTDPNRVTQVLMNLLTNAAKFTWRGNVTFGYEVRPGSIYFYVRDTGIGIPKEGMPMLFVRFKKLDNFAQGTGLGLSISKGIVEHLGGEIGVESEGQDKGSLFWFTIPVGRADEESVVPER